MQIYDEMQKYEQVQVQSNLNGYHTKRKPIGQIEHNHRKIAIQEVVFDIDTHNMILANEIANSIISKLILDKLVYSLWDTSRSYHIHLFFLDMEKYPVDARKKIRTLILKKYGLGFTQFLDFAKCSENVMIRDFNTTHEKTRKKKRLIEQNATKLILNPIPCDVLEKALSQPKSKKVLRIENKADLMAFVEYCVNTKFLKEGGRNQILFKNVAIAFYLAQIPLQDAEPYFRQIALNSGKRHFGLIGWYKWASKKRDVQVGWKELQNGGFYGKNESNTTQS